MRIEKIAEHPEQRGSSPTLGIVIANVANVRRFVQPKDSYRAPYVHFINEKTGGCFGGGLSRNYSARYARLLPLLSQDRFHLLEPAT